MSQSYQRSQSQDGTSSSSCQNPGKRPKKFQSLRERRDNLQKKYSGLKYKNRVGTEYSAVHFNYVRECCRKRCWERLTEEDQMSMFTGYFTGQSKEMQDMQLAGYMERKRAKTHKTQAKYILSDLWNYRVECRGIEVPVCQKFVMNLFHVSRKRIRVIQSKIKEQTSFKEKRGTHSNRPRKIQCSIWRLVRAHLKSIPHRRSHYQGEKSWKLYFENPNLTWVKIFELFRSFYLDKMGSVLKLTYSTYHKYVKNKLNYAFRVPRTDVCDFCSSAKVKLQSSPEDSVKYQLELHEMKYTEHRKLKKDLITECQKPDSKIMVIEFDYAQNYVLPKINEDLQYYKTLLNMYVFNVHCHNDGTSTMYHFLETDSPKNGHTVASFIFDFLQLKLEAKDVTTVHFFSDAASSQNKNQNIVQFCSWLSTKYQIEIIHWFPERGHSYGQCDRNFGECRAVIKAEERVFTSIQYAELMKAARKNPSPFLVKDGRPLLQQWHFGNLDVPKFNGGRVKGIITPQFEIQSYCCLHFQPGGYILAGPTYHSEPIPFKYDAFSSPRTLLNEKSLQPPERVPITSRKEEDLQSLFPFFSEETRNWYSDIFEQSRQQVQRNEIIDVDDHLLFSESDSDGDFHPDKYILCQYDEDICLYATDTTGEDEVLEDTYMYATDTMGEDEVLVVDLDF